MIRNIILFIWFSSKSIAVLALALVKGLPKFCENLRIKAEEIEKLTKEFNEQKRRQTKR